MLFVSKDENVSLKILDFGLADFIKPDARLSEIAGTPGYMAPEMLQRAYNIEADNWSVGIIAYALISGSRPFEVMTGSEYSELMYNAELKFDEEPWPSISAQAKDFLRHLLHKDPRKRSTAAQTLAHPWIEDMSRGGKQQVDSTSVSLVGSERIRTSGSVGQQLKEAQGINKFLVALGGFISAVNQAHIPYRNHKLTMLLSDYLRRNAKKPTVMNISPVVSYMHETYSSLW
ncbi:hypothetical protein R1flu_027395 [Riccia fluitans]|uniref:Protein kinase domain-containing protein n=1 Tax=Riccia fluitans TaxID=41844 RepID=A0ABD1XIQ4_9MARC